MGNKIYVSRFINLFITIAVVSFCAAPFAANAAATSVTQRLCDRQSALLGRLARAIIDPALCGQTPAAPVVTFSANPPSIQSGGSSNLSWSSINATSCTASGGWSGAKNTSGNQQVSPTQTTTYTLTCTGTGGSDTESVTVTVTQAPIAPTVDITADPTTITAGGTSELEWNSENATSCTASNGWTGSKDLDGSQNVSPTVTTTYAISCTGPGGTANDSVTVTVNAVPTPTLTLDADPDSVTAGGTSNLTWDSTNATACVASNGWTGSKALDGSEQVTVSATSTYTLACGNGTSTSTQSVTVNVTPTQSPTPTVTLTASPTSVTPGAGTATTTLTWVSTNATSCTAFGGWTGSRGLSGSEVVTPSATTTYQLDCTGPGGVGSDDAVVNFVPSPQEEPDPTLTFSANPTTVNEGSQSSATTTLTWDSTNATECTASGASEWTGDKAVDGSEVVTPTADVTYELDCSGPGGTVHQEVVIDFVPTPEPSVDHLLISEVYYDVDVPTRGVDTTNEWVELYNPTDSLVDLTNWWIGDRATTSLDKIPNGTTIPAGGFLVITAASTTSGFWAGTPMITLENPIGGGLANGGDSIFLLNANGATTTVDAVSWGNNPLAFSPSVTGAADNSIFRTNVSVDTDAAGDWSTDATPTPGE